MEKPKTENLTAWITGRNLNIYQKADAVIEYNKLLEYVSDLENQSTSQKETIDRLMDILQKTTETLMAVRRHGIREEEGYETVVTLLGESINESEQVLKETEPIDQ